MKILNSYNAILLVLINEVDNFLHWGSMNAILVILVIILKEQSSKFIIF